MGVTLPMILGRSVLRAISLLASVSARGLLRLASSPPSSLSSSTTGETDELLPPTGAGVTQPEPEPAPEPLVQPTAIQVTDRHRDAYDRAPALMPVKMNHPERVRIREACSAARQHYPAAVAKVLVAELMAFDEFGYRWAKPGTVGPLIDHLLKPAATPSEAA